MSVLSAWLPASASAAPQQAGATTPPLHVWNTQAQATGTRSVRLTTDIQESQVSGPGTLVVDWGDGQQSTLDYTDDASRWMPAAFAHSYAQPGVYTVKVTASEGNQTASQQVSVTTRGSEFFPVGPSRVLDTRTGKGTGIAARVTSGWTVTIDPATFPGRPSGPLSAVVLNLTAVTPSGNGYVTAWSDISGSRPSSSSLNYLAGQTRANTVTVPVGPDGKIHLYNQGGTVDLLADVEGYYAVQHGQGYHPLVPVRLLDTRTAFNGRAAAKVPGRGSTTFTVAGTSHVPTQGATAVALNLTETGSTAPGFVTAYPDGTALPQASNLNFGARQDVPNLVIVPSARTARCGCSTAPAGPSTWSPTSRATTPPRRASTSCPPNWHRAVCPPPTRPRSPRPASWTRVPACPGRTTFRRDASGPTRRCPCSFPRS
ncbi:hypothetical protein ACFQZC_02670 [Streptacidiphilus monticola]